MRLLNVETRKLETVYDPIPEYAILSHTWGDEEVTFDDVRHGYSGGSVKIDGCCEQAAGDGIHHVWIDTICIDKSSSAELSEAINSMFAWYRDSKVCYSYLADVPSEDDPTLPGSHFRDSRWFTRGWTLQELLAPAVVQFFSSTWVRIGEKSAVAEPNLAFMQTIAEITGIARDCLSASSPAFQAASVAQKMSWAAGRKTTRREDRAYSLMGIFGVNMPMLYGEGENAFVRLQEEIMRLSDDRTILAWGYGMADRPAISAGREWNKGSLFAASPDEFQHCRDVVRVKRRGKKMTHFFMTNRGLQIELFITKILQSPGTVMVDLECSTTSTAGLQTMGLAMVRSREHDSEVSEGWEEEEEDDDDDNDQTYSRIDGVGPILVTTNFFGFLSPTTTFIGRRHISPGSVPFRDPKIQITDRIYDLGYAPVGVYPPGWAPIISSSGMRVLISPRPYYVHGEKIFILYESEGKPSLVVRLDYNFGLGDRLAVQPRNLKCSLSLIDEEPAQDILGLFGPYLGEVQMLPEWCRDFDRWTSLKWNASVEVDGKSVRARHVPEMSEGLMLSWQVNVESWKEENETG